MIYESTFEVGDCRLSELSSLMDKCREYGAAEFSPGTNTVTVKWIVDEPGEIPDLWELRIIVEELEAELSTWLHRPRVPKPKRVWTGAPGSGGPQAEV